MTLYDVLKGLSARFVTADAEALIKDVVKDSRKVTPGSVFFACPGENGDGGDYAEEAVRSGAVAVICEKRPAFDCPYALVRDAREAYACACAHMNGDPQKRLDLIAVTGTNGKTTVTSMIYHILTKLNGQNSAALIGGVCNVIGGKRYEAEMTTPDPSQLYALLSEAKAAGARYAVLDASSHALDYKKLSPCRMRLGVMTNLTEDHLDYHKTTDNYFNSKKQLVGLCKEFISNGDDPFTKTLGCPHVSLYGGEFTAGSVELCPDHITFDYRGRGAARCTVPVIGKFNVYNALAALASAETVGCDATSAAEALSDFPGAEGRFSVYKLVNGADAVIDYAHTPDALENALTEARRICRGRLICVFGCGGDREKNKRAIMGQISGRLADHTVITSDNSRSEEPEDIIGMIVKGICREASYEVIADRAEAVRAALSMSRSGDVVLLAGKGHEKYEYGKYGKRPFCEADIIREYNDGGCINGDNDSG